MPRRLRVAGVTHNPGSHRLNSLGSGELTKGMRLKSVRHPNARLDHYDYDAAGTTDPHADDLNRLHAIKEDSGGSPGSTLAQYTYVGMGMIVVEDYEQPDVKLDLFGGSTGTYAGFDRFGRVVNHKWYDYGASAIRDQYTYGYDRAGNRNYRENTGPAAKDEFYTYDGMYQLANFDRGDLNEGKTAISGTPVREEDFSLDPTGNWTDYLQKTSGTTVLDQDREHNMVNEIDTDQFHGDADNPITQTTGTAWADPVYDAAGNTTTVPKAWDLSTGLTCKYDAWNRLAEVVDGEVGTFKYECDGLNRRTKKSQDYVYVEGFEHFYYNGSWQVLETRVYATDTPPEGLQPQYQYVWSPRYVDAAVLRDENWDSDGLCDDRRIYYLGDANFNVTTLVDTGGDAVERYLYDPYGKDTIYTPDWSSTRSSSNYGNAIRYTGREFDAETWFYHYRNRYYSVELGRFLSRDPIGYEDGLNVYAYTQNNPLNRIDPQGLGILDALIEAITPPRPCGTVQVSPAAGSIKFRKSGTCPPDGRIKAGIEEEVNRPRRRDLDCPAGQRCVLLYVQKTTFSMPWIIYETFYWNPLTQDKAPTKVGRLYLGPCTVYGTVVMRVTAAVGFGCCRKAP